MQGKNIDNSYRKMNDRSIGRGVYHKKDGTNRRAKIKEETKKIYRELQND